MADAQDLKSWDLKKSCGFESHHRHHTEYSDFFHMKCHSHIGQDAWVAECLQFKKDGYFLDFGAFDGKLTSNTYALEHDLGWRGICVEPNPKHYAAVCECRRCVAVNVALWPQSREQLRFVDAYGLSSLEQFKDVDVNAQKRAEATNE